MRKTTGQVPISQCGTQLIKHIQNTHNTKKVCNASLRCERQLNSVVGGTNHSCLPLLMLVRQTAITSPIDTSLAHQNLLITTTAVEHTSSVAVSSFVEAAVSCWSKPKQCP